MQLFDDEEGEVSMSLGKNHDYAERFERRHRKQELAQLRAKFGDDAGESDSESSEDEDARLLTPALDAQILSAIDKIKHKKPEVYESKGAWFEEGEEEGEEEEDEEEEEGGGSANGVRKPVRLRDQLLTHGAEALVSDSDDEAEEGGRGGPSKVRAYDEEQRRLRKAFLNEANAAATAADEDGLLLKKKTLSATSAKAYNELLHQHADGSDTLQRYLASGDSLDPNEQFLRDYVINARWKQTDDGQTRSQWRADRGGGREEEEGEEDREGEDGEEERFSDREEEYERTHNFRFEEAGAAEVVGHARHAAGSMRRQAALTRKQAEEAERKARKQAARERKEEELKRLKNLKKQEILSRLQEIQKVSGSAVPLTEVDLTGDFDPEAWDKKMAQVFNEEYYEQADEDYRPEEYYEAAGSAEDPTQGFEAVATKLKKSKNKKVQQTAQQYMDEYYALDYEDLIGDLPTRFKYRQVPATGFGVTDQELLEEDEKSLAKRVPLRYIKRPYAQYDERKLKGRANKVRWQEKGEEATLKAKAEARAASEKMGQRKKKHRGSGEGGSGKGTGAVTGERTAEAKAARPPSTDDGGDPAEDQRRTKQSRPNEAKRKKMAAAKYIGTSPDGTSRLEVYASLKGAKGKKARSHELYSPAAGKSKRARQK